MKHIINAVEKRKKQIIALAKNIVEIPTVNPPGMNYERCVEFLELSCKKAGLKTRRYYVPKPELKKLGIEAGFARVNLVASWDTGAKKTLHINGHYDVVPATGNWQTDPFKPRIKDGKLFGRGSEDMKANIACMISAVDVLQGLKICPAVNVELSFTPDEETGGQTGLAYLLKKKLIKADYAIGEGYEDDYAAIGNKGMLWLEVGVYGTSAHASTPYRGENAFEHMLEISRAVSGLESVLNRRRTRCVTRDKRDAYSTLVVGGKIAGGNKTNIVPDYASFSIDRRLIPEETVAEARRELEGIIRAKSAKNRNVRVKIRTTTAEEPVISKRDDHFLDVFSKALSSVLAKKLKTAIMPGGTDLRFFIRQGVPCLGYSVKGGQRAHADNEFVYCKSIIDTTKIFALVINGLNRVKQAR
ncbi:MAG: M20 family metallopeptidase [Candidatus Omnitrophica bacterium]|nr:M20 family metallopeptidase [Candidatus Omnitrophota bacterium]MBU4479029.1 M20 family metallopeptidase [Candidatus Omnitrophota bacterium]